MKAINILNKKLKKILAISLLLLLSNVTFAQFYIKGCTGFSFSTNPQKIPNYYLIDNIEQGFYNVKYYGKGMDLGVNVGYNFNNTIGFELGVRKQLFTKSQFENDWLALIEDAEHYKTSGFYGKSESKNHSIELTPQLVYTFTNKNWNPYIKLGVTLLKMSSIVNYQYADLETENVIKQNFEYTGSWNVGFIGNLGVSYRISNKLSCFAEFTTVNVNYVFKQVELKAYSIDGVDIIPHVDDKVYEYNGNKGMIDFSHIGLNIGVKYSFSK